VKYSVADIEMAQRLIVSDSYIMQEKIDGERLTITIDQDGISGWNKRGERTSLSPWLYQEMQNLPESPWKFDGEYCKDRYVIFDLMETPRQGLNNKPLAERIAMLDVMIETWGIEKIQAAPTWLEPRDKLRGYIQVAVKQGEGVVFRPRLATTAYPGQVYKHKFRNSVDAVVMSNPAGKASIEVGVYDGDVLTSLGKVTGSAEPGSVVEISYRKLTVLNKMIEPVLIRSRTDKLPFACTFDQLKETKATQDTLLLDRQKQAIARELRMTPQELADITENLY